jgi:hypothetical protein
MTGEVNEQYTVCGSVGTGCLDGFADAVPAGLAVVVIDSAFSDVELREDERVTHGADVRADDMADVPKGEIVATRDTNEESLTFNHEARITVGDYLR